MVGGSAAAIIDPGPACESHLASLADAVSGAQRVVVLLTHAHADHAEGARGLAEMLRAGAGPGGPGGQLADSRARATGSPVEVAGPGGDRAIEDGDAFATSDGTLTAVSTPGHARRHFCFHLPSTGAVFVGDLVLGTGDTTWVGEYPGAVAQYLESLDRLDALRPRILHPAHGPDIVDPAAAIDRFRRHRLSRIAMVQDALDAGHADPADIARHVYGALPRDVRAMAVASVQAILDYLSRAK